MSTMLDLKDVHTCFGGAQRTYQHASREIGLPMKFSVFLPPRAVQGRRVPAVVLLAGLTCNEETFMTKAGAQRVAADLGLALIAPDTSPRGTNLPNESSDWEFGVGASFYLDATQEPWERYWRMESYLLKELLPLISVSLPIDPAALGICGHSMGGHGALTLALRHRDKFRSVSAFAPISHPTQCAWGQKAFKGYLGDDEIRWAQHDATLLMQRQSQPPYPGGILIDQGMADKYLFDKQLLPEAFEAACQKVGQPLTLRYQPGYDHGYYFIQTFIADHLQHHARQLAAG